MKAMPFALAAMMVALAAQAEYPGGHARPLTRPLPHVAPVDAPPGRTPAAEPGSSPTSSFTRLDSDGDGALTPGEVASDRDLAARFDQLDQNGDRRLQPEELSANVDAPVPPPRR